MFGFPGFVAPSRINLALSLPVAKHRVCVTEAFRRTQPTQVCVSNSSFLAVETSSLPSTKFTTDLLLLDWIDFANSVLLTLYTEPLLTSFRPSVHY